MVFIKVVELFSERNKSNEYVAIAHVNLYMNNVRKNLEIIRKTILFMSENNIELIIIPYFDPYGPILGEYVNLDKRIVKKYALTTRSNYMSELQILAKEYGTNILLPGFVENAGVREYLSAVLFRKETGEVVKYRKIFLSENEYRIGFGRGTKLGIFDLYETSFSLMIDTELYYPEIARILLSFSDFLVAGIPQNIPIKNYLNVVKSISQINSSIVIIPGSRVYYTDKLYYNSPTIIIDENGDIIYRYSDDEQAIILIPIDRLVRDKRNNVKDIETIYNIFKKYVKKMNTHGNRESSSYKNE